MPLFKYQDPVQLYIQGQITEEKLQKRLKRLSPANIAVFDTDSWCRFLIEINEQHHHIPVSAETKKLIVKWLSEEQLIDVAIKSRGNDYINALAIFEMKDQDSLRTVLQYFHRFTPFRTFMWQGEKLVYTDRPIDTAFERGGLAVWAVLQRIDQEHFRQAWENCGRRSQWIDQLRAKKGEGRYFSGEGFPGWGDRGVICYMDLLPAAEHRIILAESGVEMKRPHYMQQ